MKTYLPHKSSLGNISANIIAMIIYLAFIPFSYFAFAMALVIYFVEQNSGLIKFHAVQAMSLWGFYFIAGSATSVMNRLSFFNWTSRLNMFDIWDYSGSVIGVFIRFALFILMAAGCVVGAIKSYGWNEFVIPGIGDFAMRIFTKGNAAKYNGDGPVPEDCKLGYVMPYQNDYNPNYTGENTDASASMETPPTQGDTGSYKSAGSRPAPPPFKQAQPPYMQPQQYPAPPAAYTATAKATQPEPAEPKAQPEVTENKQENPVTVSPVYSNYIPAQETDNNENSKPQ